MRHFDFKEVSDDKLFLYIKEGNHLAFRQLYHRYWEGLFGFTLNILKDKALSEDAVQELFTKIWVDKNTLEIENIKSYLYTAARNRSLLKLRYTKKFSELDVSLISNYILSPQTEVNSDFKDLKSRIEAAAYKLPKRCREIFFMSRFNDYSISEIAVHFNISSRTVENQITLALKHIREVLSKIVTLFFMM